MAARKKSGRKATSPARKATARPKARTARKTASRKPARKTASRKAAAGKTTARKTAASKTAARKTTARKTTARKTAAPKAASRKTASRKTASRKTAARQTAAPKTSTSRTSMRKTGATSAAAPRATTRKTTAPRKPAAPSMAASASPAVRLTRGVQAPSFALSDQSGRLTRTSDFVGHKLLVYFYPKADTPGCTVQSCSLRDHRQDLKSLGIDVVGVSPDAPKAQAKFDEKYSLGFPLLSDEDHVMAEAFGVWGEKSMYGRKYMGIVRSSFLIDEQGRISGAWYGVKPEETVALARAAL